MLAHPLTSSQHPVRPPDLTRPAARRLHALTALRFVAAAAIVVTHTADLHLLPRSAISPFLLFQAVSFFFVLSGFILAYVYPALDTWNARGHFLLARFARIWPAHIIALLLLILINHNPLGYPAHSAGDWLRPLGVNLLMLQSWLPYPWVYFAYNPAAWSISTEFAFYLMFPLLIHRWSRTWWWKLPLAAALAVLMIALGNRPDVPASAAPVPGQLHQTTMVGLVYSHPVARLFEFVLGMTVALLWRRTTAALHLGRIAGTLLELAACILVVANMYYAAGFIHWARGFAWIGPGGAQWLEQGGSVCFAFAALIYVMAREEGWISRALSAPPAVLLGEISFSVYLLQQVLLMWYGYHSPYLYAVAPWKILLIFWSVLLVAAFLVWAAAERPLRRSIVRLWPAPPERSASRSGARQALEVPGGRTRSRWDLLLNPGPRVTLAAALLIALLAGFVLAELRTLEQPHISFTPEFLAARDQAVPESRGIRFDGRFVLAGVRYHNQGDDGLDVIVTWQALQPAMLAFTESLAVVGADGRTLARIDQPQDPDQGTVSTGEMWTDVIHLKAEQLTGAAAIGLSLHVGDQMTLMPDAGTRDLSGARLRVPLPPDVLSTATAPSSRP
ncbi:MAG TPA: acyltransferase [Phycisphaerae bacterium]|nr:acyltransferase [Phycisphaerae bacterium]